MDGRWSDWGDWSTCSLPCGGGTQERLRTCTNPPPAYGGAQCSEESKEIRSCNSHPCPGKKSNVEHLYAFLSVSSSLNHRKMTKGSF